jgi:hypothetical protein
MADYTAVFRRYEIKFILTLNEYTQLKALMQQYMQPDKYGVSTICNLYFDTPDFLLIRRSLDKPFYKEKLRLRSYGVCREDSPVFPELKKKYDSVVYKRRLEMTYSQAINCLTKKTPLPDTQIGREIAFCFARYKNLAPRVFLSYDRQAFYSNDDPEFRMTFDRNITWRTYDLSLTSGVYGNKVLDDDKVLLEVKTSSSIPLWLVKFLSSNKIYKTTFSKYGRAYIQILKEKNMLGGFNCA